MMKDIKELGWKPIAALITTTLLAIIVGVTFVVILHNRAAGGVEANAPLGKTDYMRAATGIEDELLDYLNSWTPVLQAGDPKTMAKFSEGLRYYATKIEDLPAADDAAVERGMAIIASRFLDASAAEFDFALKAGCQQCFNFSLKLVQESLEILSALTERPKS